MASLPGCNNSPAFLAFRPKQYGRWKSEAATQSSRVSFLLGVDDVGGVRHLSFVVCMPCTTSTHPHVTLWQLLYFKHPPVSVIPASTGPITGVVTPRRTITYRWDNDFREAVNNDSVLHLPIYIAHEFGYTAGL